MRISDWSSDVCSSDLADHSQMAVVERADRKSRRLSAAGGAGRTHRHRAAAPRGSGSRAVLDARLGGAVLRLVPGLRIGREMGAEGGLAMASSAGSDQRFHVPGWLDMLGYFVRSEEHTSELQSLMRIS